MLVANMRGAMSQVVNSWTGLHVHSNVVNLLVHYIVSTKGMPESSSTPSHHLCSDTLNTPHSSDDMVTLDMLGESAILNVWSICLSS